jgi:hypothetical protein
MRESLVKNPAAHPQRATIAQAVLCLVLILAVLQLWLLTATLNASLGGDDSVVWPAALASAVCLAANVGLLRSLRAHRPPADLSMN